jgi:hypothetical protein
MKKTTKKLSLSPETLRRLTRDDLRGAAGGAPGDKLLELILTLIKACQLKKPPATAAPEE